MAAEQVRLLVDKGIARPIIVASRGRNCDVLSVAEAAPNIQDRGVIDWANREERVLVSGDYGFGDLVYRLKLPALGSS